MERVKRMFADCDDESTNNSTRTHPESFQTPLQRRANNRGTDPQDSTRDTISSNDTTGESPTVIRPRRLFQSPYPTPHKSTNSSAGRLSTTPAAKHPPTPLSRSNWTPRRTGLLSHNATTPHSITPLRISSPSPPPKVLNDATLSNQATSPQDNRPSLRSLNPPARTFDQLQMMGINDEILNMDYESALTHRFFHDNTPAFTNAFGRCSSVGWEEMTRIINRLARSKAEEVGDEWIQNHYRLTVWKLAAYARTFPDLKNCFTVFTVIQQLQSRWEREAVQCQRSVLKRISEGDETPGRPMVLMCCDSPAQDTLTQAGTPLYRVRVSDGWYTMNASLDQGLTALAKLGRVRPGCKLLVCGAQLNNVPQACPPLALPANARLALCRNGTVQVAWHSRLGLSRMFPLKKISSLRGDGGIVPVLTLLIHRKLPDLRLVRDNDATIKMSVSCERVWSRDREAVVERERQAVQDILTIISEYKANHKSPAAKSGDELFSSVVTGANPSSAWAELSPADKSALSEYVKRQGTEALVQEIKTLRPNWDCRVTSLARFSVTDEHNTRAELSLYCDAEGDADGLIKPNLIVQVCSVTLRSFQGRVYLSTNRRSQCRVISSHTSPSEEISVPPMFSSITSVPATWTPLNLVGIVVAVQMMENAPVTGLQHVVFLCDSTETIVAIETYSIRMLPISQIKVGQVLCLMDVEVCDVARRPTLVGVRVTDNTTCVAVKLQGDLERVCNVLRPYTATCLENFVKNPKHFEQMRGRVNGLLRHGLALSLGDS
eukprot:c20595_g1_i4.p1 GENE.c20595_g1_i4~~c20595_g1_i4.p1  ORF type:complete len:860 (+),score=132.27 c20595_g1_i4:256-2580(+)